jgi:ABC-type polysaccharide/polyol phosphate export permease
MKKSILELIRYRELVRNLTLTELKLRYRDSALGFLWTVLNPLFYLLILALVFSKIIRLQIPGYAIFLFAGLASWLMIQQTVIIATGSVVNNQTLIRKIYVPKLVFPVSNVLARFVDHGILVVLLVVFMAVFGARFTWALAFLPVVVLIHFLGAFGLSLLLSVAFIRFRDVQNIAAIVFQALFYATPIIYSIDVLPEAYRPLFLWNPFYYYVETLRWPVYHGALPPWNIVGIAAAISVALFLTGWAVFIRQEKNFVFSLS